MIFYTSLAGFVALGLTAANRWWRLAGTLAAAAALAMMVLSIGLAELDGTFARMPAGDGALHAAKPLLLNVGAAIGAAATLFLLWAAWAQLRRRQLPALPLRNGPDGFGRLARLAHWATAVLVLAALPMGMFVTVLGADAPERASFLATHTAIGIAVLVLAGARLAWRLASPAPPATTAARAVQALLYGSILLFPLSGLLLPADWARVLHGSVLPVVLVAAITAHIGAAAWRHFAGGDRAAIRRMLR